MIDANDNRLTPYEREIAAMRGDGANLDDNHMLACCALGLVEEIEEARAAMYLATMRAWHAEAWDCREDVLRELGDVLWYATTALHRVDQGAMQAAATSESSTQWGSDTLAELQSTGAEFAGVIKKALFHDRGIAASRAKIIQLLGDCIKLIEACARRVNATFGDVERANISKIRARFPSGGFTTAEANARVDEQH